MTPRGELAQRRLLQRRVVEGGGDQRARERLVALAGAALDLDHALVVEDALDVELAAR